MSRLISKFLNGGNPGGTNYSAVRKWLTTEEGKNYASNPYHWDKGNLFKGDKMVFDFKSAELIKQDLNNLSSNKLTDLDIDRYVSAMSKVAGGRDFLLKRGLVYGNSNLKKTQDKKLSTKNSSSSNSKSSTTTNLSGRYFNLNYDPSSYGVNNRDDVIRMLNELIANGYDIGSKTGKADGIWGRKTQAAYEAYLNELANNFSPAPQTVVVTPDSGYRSTFDYSGSNEAIRNFGFNNYEGLKSFTRANPTNAFARDLIQRFGDVDKWTLADIESALGVRGRYRRGREGDYSDIMRSMAEWAGKNNAEYDLSVNQNNTKLIGTPLLGLPSSNNYNIDTAGNVYYKGQLLNLSKVTPTYNLGNNKLNNDFLLRMLNLMNNFNKTLPSYITSRRNGGSIDKFQEGGFFTFLKNKMLQPTKPKRHVKIPKRSISFTNTPIQVQATPGSATTYSTFGQHMPKVESTPAIELGNALATGLAPIEVGGLAVTPGITAYASLAPIQWKKNGGLISKDPVKRFQEGGFFKRVLSFNPMKRVAIADYGYDVNSPWALFEEYALVPKENRDANTVKILQDKLYKANAYENGVPYKKAVDGYFGPMTKNAAYNYIIKSGKSLKDYPASDEVVNTFFAIE